MVFIYTTCENSVDAKRLGKIIIESKLGACVDFWPIQSMYYWEGKLEEREQIMLLVTTLESKLEDVHELIAQNHTYSTPIIAGVDIRRLNREYKEWMTGELG
jgi:periplasmic divalent cation tolerance protein